MSATGDVTVSAAGWLATPDADLAALPRRDADWRTPLPTAAPVVLETMPTSVIRRLGDAAAATLRATADGGLGGRAVGQRMLREALLDHLPIVVLTDATAADDGGEPVGGEAVGGEAVGGEAVGGEQVGGEPVGGDSVGGLRVGGLRVGGQRVGGQRVGVPQRLVQAVVRMGFLGADDEPVHVVHSGPPRPGGWVGIAAGYGTAWWRSPSGLTLRPTR